MLIALKIDLPWREALVATLKNNTPNLSLLASVWMFVFRARKFVNLVHATFTHNKSKTQLQMEYPGMDLEAVGTRAGSDTIQTRTSRRIQWYQNQVWTILFCKIAGYHICAAFSGEIPMPRYSSIHYGFCVIFRFPGWWKYNDVVNTRRYSMQIHFLPFRKTFKSSWTDEFIVTDIIIIADIWMSSNHHIYAYWMWQGERFLHIYELISDKFCTYHASEKVQVIRLSYSNLLKCWNLCREYSSLAPSALKVLHF